MPERLTARDMGRLASALPILHELEEQVDLHHRADAIVVHMPRELRQLCEGAIQADTFGEQTIIALATRVHPRDRAQHLARLQELIAGLEGLVAQDVDPDDGSGPMFDADEIRMFHALVIGVTKMASRSRREVSHFFDAMRQNDNAVLVIEFQAHTGRESTVEARYAPDISADTRNSLKLRSSRPRPAAVN